MKLKLKKFNALKTLNYLYTHNLIFFFQGVNLKNTSWLKIEQLLFNNNLKYYKLKNSITYFNLKNSIFKNLSPLINSTNFLINLTSSKNLNFKKLTKLDSFFYLLLIKLNNKIYFINEYFSITSFNYQKTISSFIFLLNKISKSFVRMFKNFSKL